MAAEPTFKKKYREEAAPALAKKFGLTNPNRVPRLLKIVVNMGLGVKDKDAIKSAVEDLTRITGQKPLMTLSRKSISNFKIREGMVLGAKVTLRGNRMFEFLERFVTATLPRIRDFRGLPPNAFDGRGSYTMGIKEQSIFPEIDPNNIKSVQGMDVTFVTTAPSDDEARELLRLMGIPFAKKSSGG